MTNRILSPRKLRRPPSRTCRLMTGDKAQVVGHFELNVLFENLAPKRRHLPTQTNQCPRTHPEIKVLLCGVSLFIPDTSLVSVATWRSRPRSLRRTTSGLSPCIRLRKGGIGRADSSHPQMSIQRNGVFIVE